MREIKFRAWDKSKKRMVDEDELVFWGGCCYLNESKTLYNPNKPHSPAKLKGYSILENYVMQFTGLSDKNGKEIYEGDILEWQFEWQKEKHIGAVKISISGTSVGGNAIQVRKANTIYSIIGNIYENPELLER